MTRPDDAQPTVRVLRELFRNLQYWRSAYETHGLDTLTGPDGRRYHLLDIEHLYSCRHLLSARQREAIEWCLVGDQREIDVAVAMHVSPTNPVASYATQGMRRLLQMQADGQLPAPVRRAAPAVQVVHTESPESPEDAGLILQAAA